MCKPVEHINCRIIKHQTSLKGNPHSENKTYHPNPQHRPQKLEQKCTHQVRFSSAKPKPIAKNELALHN